MGLTDIIAIAVTILIASLYAIKRHYDLQLKKDSTHESIERLRITTHSEEFRELRRICDDLENKIGALSFGK